MSNNDNSTTPFPLDEAYAIYLIDDEGSEAYDADEIRTDEQGRFLEEWSDEPDVVGIATDKGDEGFIFEIWIQPRRLKKLTFWIDKTKPYKPKD